MRRQDAHVMNGPAAAMIRQVASVSQAAMTSGQADIHWTGSGFPAVIQEITFDGGNWNDVNNPGVPIQVHHHGRMVSWTGESINRVVDGQAYHYPAIVPEPQPHVTAGYTTVDGAQLEDLRATTPGAVSLTSLNDVIQSEPDNAQASALDLWIDPAGVQPDRAAADDNAAGG